ncbi:hypothetical protein FXO37_21701 [Capsicum annuum]|nr:hypothetical protein FXO37_21701 [Capsicum annuum]
MQSRSLSSRVIPLLLEKPFPSVALARSRDDAIAGPSFPLIDKLPRESRRLIGSFTSLSVNPSQISFDDDSEDVSEEEGMPLAIQVWLYECCSNVPPKISSKVDNRIPRLLNWKTIALRPRFEFLMNAIFNENGKVVFKNIEPTKKKLSKLQIP